MLGLIVVLGKSLSGPGCYLDTLKFADEIGVPVLAPKLSIGDHRQTDVLLHTHDLTDCRIFDFSKHRGINLASCEIGSRRMDTRRAEQAADRVGTKLRSLSHIRAC